MKRPSALATIALDAGGLILSWVLGVLELAPYATIAVIVFMAGDGLRRWYCGLGFPRVWWLFNGLALVLAITDLIVVAWLPAAYEPIPASLVFAVVFALGASGRRPIVQEIAEQRRGAPFPPERHDLRAFFRLYSWIWALYFFIRAGLYLWFAHNLSPERAHALENMIGPVSLFVMIMSSFRGQALFQLAQRAGLLGQRAGLPAPAPDRTRG